MERKIGWQRWVAGVCLVMAVSGRAFGVPGAEDLARRREEWRKKTVAESYPGEEIVAERILYDYPSEARSGGWNFADGTLSGIGYLDPNMQNVRVENGNLKFTMGAERVLFGWGQLDRSFQKEYAAPLDMRTYGWHMAWKAVLRADRVPLNVTGTFYRFGKETKGITAVVGKTGAMTTIPADWPNNSVREESYQGFALVLSGQKGTTVEIEQVSAGREVVRSYCRKVFELPADDPVYSAIVNVGMNNAAFINGIRVHDKEDLTAAFEYNVVPVDIKMYLKPGKNVFALFSELINNGPCTYAAGAVILASGKEIPLTTAEGYVVSGIPVAGWTQAGFDDSNWKKPNVRVPNGLTYGQTYPSLYWGPILLENPSFLKLMYETGKEIVVTVKLPAGYAAAAPAVDFSLTDEDTGKQVASGALAAGKVEGPALVRRLTVPSLPKGIYDLSVRVRTSDGKEISRTTPLMVTGPVVQKEVESYEFEDGIRMTLVDEIQCHDPDDPHPYMDSEGSGKNNRIVKKDGLAYRETGQRRYRDYFAYRMEVREENLFQPHVVDIAWPDNEQRSVQIAFFGKHNSGALVGSTSFEKFPLSMGYQHFKCFWIPREKTYFILVANNMDGFRAAVHSIRIYRVDDIPALKTYPSGQRFLGQMTERNTIHGSFWDPGPYPETLYGAVGNVPDFHRRWFHANETFIKMMRFGGENLLANGVFQYTRQNLGYAPVWRAERAELDFNYLSMLAKQFEYHGMILVPCTEFRYTDSMAGKGGYERFTRVVADLADQFRIFPSFKGVQFLCFPPFFENNRLADFFAPGIASGMVPFQQDEPYTPLLAGYDDPMIEAFSREEKVNIPVAFDDEHRLLKRYRWIRENCLENWIDWRCRKINEFLETMVEQLHKRQKDSVVYPTIDFDVFLTKPLAKSGRDPVRFLRAAGYDPSLSKDNPFISWPRFYNQMFHHNRSYGIPDWPLAEDFNTDTALTAFWTQNRVRSAFILTHFDENFVKPDPNEFPPEFEELKKRSQAGWPQERFPIFQTFMPPGEHCLAAFRDIIRDCDPNVLFYGWSDGVMPLSHLHYLRRISRAFLALPGEKFTPLKGNGLDRNIVVKELRKDGRYYFYVLNDTCWNVSVSLSLNVTGPVKDIGASRVERPAGNVLRFELLPYEMRSFMMEGSGSVKSGQAEAALAARRALAEKVTGLRGMLSQAPMFEKVFRGPALDSFVSALDGAGRAEAAGDIGTTERFLRKGIVQDMESYRLPNARDFSSWYVIAGFPGDRYGTGFTTAYPVEKDVLASGKPDLKKVYKGAEGQFERATWTKLVSQEWFGLKDCVVLHDLYGQPEWMEAYAWSRVWSPEDRRCVLQVRSDDGVRVWLDGTLVHSHRIGRGITWDPDTVDVSLKKGWNSVLVKLENEWSGWGFQLRFLKPDGTAYEDVSTVCDEG